MKINNENYYDVSGYMSASVFKAFLKCENTGLAMYQGKYSYPKTIALMVGSYVDAWCEGTLDEFQEKHPEIFNSRTGALKADYTKANAIIERIKSEPLFMEFLTGNKQEIVTGEIEGVPFKGKLDVFDGKRIVDLKILRNVERVMGKSAIEYWGYDIQLAIYQELKFQQTGKKFPCYLAIATKEEPSDLTIVHVSQSMLDEALEVVKKNLPRIKKIIDGEIKPRHCNQCAYCRETKEVKVIDSELLGLSDEDIFYITGEEV